MSAVWSWWRAAADYLIGSAAAAFWLFVSQWVVCTVQRVLCYVYDLFLSLMMPWMLVVLRNIPSMPVLRLDFVAQIWRIGNYWFPLNESIALVTTCLAIAFLWRSFRFAKQFLIGASN